MKVIFDNVYNAFQIIAPKGTMISFTGEPTALADGVYLVGDDGIINLDEQFLTDTLYLSTEGTDYAVTGGMRVTYPLGDETVIIRAGSSTIPFSKGGKGGGGSGGDNTHYKGTTTTPISNGSKTNPITIDGESYTAIFGDIVVYGYTEFVFDGSAWSEFGRPFDTTPTSGSANAVTSDGIYRKTPLTRYQNSMYGGSSTSVGNNQCFAYGVGCMAAASRTVAFGDNTKATQDNMVAIGKFNSPNSGDVFNIGNGIDNNNRSNIVEVNTASMNVNGDIKKNNVSLPTPYTTMPTITAEMLGQIAQYVGETTNDYVKGYFYIASSDGAAEPTYSWVSMVDKTPTSGSKNFVTSDGVYQKTPWERGSYENTAHIGRYSAATNFNTVAMGYYANSSADGAIAVGYFAKSNQPHMFSCGQYNNPQSGHLFNIGNGIGVNNRSNILEANSTSVNINGNIQRDGIGIDDYTTTERKIGKWIDGSDLYQRTFEVTGIHNDGTYDDNILGTSDIVIRDWTGYIQYDIGIGKQHFPIYGYWSNATDWIASWTTAGCNDLSIHAKLETSTYTLDKAVITIKYTKLSAQANLMQIPTPTEEVSETPTVEENDMR